MSRALREVAGMTVAWTVMGMMFAAAIVGTMAVGVLYACMAGAHGAQQVSRRRISQRKRGSSI